jgi:hypothetical protein
LTLPARARSLVAKTPPSQEGGVFLCIFYNCRPKATLRRRIQKV